MGVQVAKSDLAAAVMRAGGIGCISSVGLGRLQESLDNYIQESQQKLREEIRRARQLAPSGVLAVNVMVALSNYDDMIRVCAAEKVDMIVSGSGLPLSLPKLVSDAPSIKLAPVVSSGRAMDVILRAWHRRYQRLPDAVIVEGPTCGGHMAFTWEQLRHPESVTIESILADVKRVLAPYEAEYGRRVPTLGAGAVCDAGDLKAMLAAGFDGVQVGTRFICSEESGIARVSKEVYVKAREADIVVLHSPLGLPVKVIRTPLAERLLRNEKIPFGCPFVCLRSCESATAKFCLADALVKTLFGDVEKGLFLVGSGIGRVNDILPAEEIVARMMG